MNTLQLLGLNLNVLWAGFRAQSKSIIRENVYIFSTIIFPFLYMALMVFYFRYAGRTDAILFAVVGTGLMGMWLVATFITAYIVVVERWSATLELIVATPSALQLWVLGRSLASTALSLVSLVITLVSTHFFSIPLTIKQPLLFVLIVIATTLTLTLLGTVISSLFVLTRSATPIANTLLYPVYILSGLVFPPSVLPAWLQPLSLISPLRWASDGLRAAILDDVASAKRSLIVLMIMSITLVVSSIWCFRIIERRVRRDATLSFH